jgi:polyisoprenoid-binding protein YceI
MKKSLIIILVAVLPVLLFAQARDFFVDGQDKRDLVTFTSHAPLETVEGKTSHIIGFVNVDPADISTAKAKFVVELATLKTGIGMRDRHMRENHLETDKYPEAVFELDHVVAEKGNDITDGQPADITLIGNFTVHGVTKPIEVKAQVQYFKDGTSSPANLPGEIIRIDAEFTVMLPDYKIERPRFLIMKLDEKQEIDVDVWASTELPKVDL